MSKVKMTFEVVVPLDIMIDEETLKKEYNNDIHEVAKFLWKEEGVWFNEELNLTKTTIIK